MNIAREFYGSDITVQPNNHCTWCEWKGGWIETDERFISRLEDDLAKCLKLLWFFLPDEEPCNPHSNKASDKERNKRWHEACNLYHKYAGQL